MWDGLAFRDNSGDSVVEYLLMFMMFMMFMMLVNLKQELRSRSRI